MQRSSSNICHAYSPVSNCTISCLRPTVGSRKELGLAQYVHTELASDRVALLLSIAHPPWRAERNQAHSVVDNRTSSPPSFLLSLYTNVCSCESPVHCSVIRYPSAGNNGYDRADQVAIGEWHYIARQSNAKKMTRWPKHHDSPGPISRTVRAWVLHTSTMIANPTACRGRNIEQQMPQYRVISPVPCSTD